MEKWICANCKAALPPDSRFCQYCGNAVSPERTKQPIKVTVRRKTGTAVIKESPAAPAPAPVCAPEIPVATGGKSAKKRRWTWMIPLFSVIGVVLTAALALAIVYFAPFQQEQTDTRPTIHVHSYTGKVTEATCTTRGYTTYTCDCGDQYTDDYVTGKHVYDIFKCKYCGKVDKRLVEGRVGRWLVEEGVHDKENSLYFYAGVSEEEDAYYFLSYSMPRGELAVERLSFFNDKSIFTRLDITKGTYTHYFEEFYVSGDIYPAIFTRGGALYSTEGNTPGEIRSTMLSLASTSVSFCLDWLEETLAKKGLEVTVADLGFTAFQ